MLTKVLTKLIFSTFFLFLKMIIDLKSVSTLTKFLLITMTTVVITNSCLFNSCGDNIYIWRIIYTET